MRIRLKTRLLVNNNSLRKIEKQREAERQNINKDLDLLLSNEKSEAEIKVKKIKKVPPPKSRYINLKNSNSDRRLDGTNQNIASAKRRSESDVQILPNMVMHKRINNMSEDYSKPLNPSKFKSVNQDKGMIVFLCDTFDSWFDYSYSPTS